MNTIKLDDYKEKEGGGSFMAYEKVLEAIGKVFGHSDKQKLNYAFQIAGNFDTLVMFCMAARDMEIDVDAVARMSLHVQLPQTYLREIRPQPLEGKESANDIKARLYRFGKDRECK